MRAEPHPKNNEGFVTTVSAPQPHCQVAEDDRGPYGLAGREARDWLVTLSEIEDTFSLKMEIQMRALCILCLPFLIT